MRFFISISLLLPTLLCAQEPLLTPAQMAKDQTLPGVSLLPAGSVLKRVLIPRYDKKRLLVASLRAEEMTVIDQNTIEGQKVSVELFNPDRSQRGRMDLLTARYDQNLGMLETKEPVEIVSMDFYASGTGLKFAQRQSRGLLLGPVETRFYERPKTAMYVPVSPRTFSPALAAALLAMNAAADPPARLTPEEREQLRQSAIPVGGLQQAASGVREQMAADAAVSKEATDAVREFLTQAAITGISLESAPQEQPKPLEVKQGPNDTIISCDDGMYLDAEKNLLVYLKNVRLQNPQFELKGANELKVFLTKKKPQEKPTGANGEKPPGGASGQPAPDSAKPDNSKTSEKKGGMPNLLGGGGFGDPEKIVATGVIQVTQKSVQGKPPVMASSTTLTYDAKSEELILSGGYPWVKQGTTCLRALEPNLYLRIKKDGSFVTEGRWDTVVEIDQLNKPKPANPR